MKTVNLVIGSSPEIDELAAFTREFKKESDRGAVLVAASRLDEVLMRLLSAYFRDSKAAQELLDGYNPLSTFAARASTAHALSLIEDHEFREITLIRKIRIEFAHKWRDIGFGSEKIMSYCSGLPWLGSRHVKATDRRGRVRFDCVVLVLLTDLLHREHLILREKRVARLWTNTTRRPKATETST